MGAPETMVRLERFEKSYGKVRAVHPLDLEVRAGESFALLGPNGGGKSTILRALVGLHAPSAGRVLIDGLDLSAAPDRVKARLSYVPQHVQLPDMLTAREVLTLIARLKDTPLARVEEVLELFALAEDADRRVLEFSGGMVQRLGLAAAFLREVPLFVLDEPTVNLDPEGLLKLRALLRRLRQSGATIVFSSHLLHSAMQLADRVAVLVEGRLVKVEEVRSFQATVTRQTAVRVVVSHTSEAMMEAVRAAGARVSSRNGKHLSFEAPPERRLEVIRAIERAGGTIEEFHTEPPDWEALLGGQLRAGGEDS